MLGEGRKGGEEEKRNIFKIVAEHIRMVPYLRRKETLSRRLCSVSNRMINERGAVCIMKIGRGNKYSEKTCPSAISSPIG
jgi:hypothetical protein